MTTTPNNPIRPDEADLLAWVEGEKLSPEMDAAVARLLMGDPGLARELDAMRGDRDVLRSLEDEKAPAGLIESVEAALQPVLERQLLLGLQDGESVESRPVVSMVRSEKRGVFQTFLMDRSGRRMAMAAGLLLVVGGGTYWATTMLSDSPQPMILALKQETPREVASPGSSSKVKVESNGAGGTAPKGEIAAEAPTIAEIPKVDLPAAVALSGSDAKDAITSTELVGPMKVPVDATRAAELAREGKLVIRVVSSQAGRTPVTVAEHLKKDCSGPGWKLASEVSSAVAVAVAPEPVDWKQIAKEQPLPEHDAVVASDFTAAGKGPEGLIGPPAPPEAVEFAIEQVPSVYMLQARLDATTMAAVRTSLQKAGRADEVVFEERYESLPLDHNAPILNPNAMVWWTNPPAGWTKWGEVPVVIDPKR